MRLPMLLLFLCGSPSPAAWITIQNDTKQTLIVQELVAVKGKVVAGKPVKLLPGEKLKEFQPGPTTKTLQILEPGQAGKMLSRDVVTVKDADVNLSIRAAAGQVKLVAAEKK